MKSYFIFTSNPIEFQLDKKNNSVTIKADKIIAHHELSKFIKEIEELNSFLQKHYKKET